MICVRSLRQYNTNEAHKLAFLKQRVQRSFPPSFAKVNVDLSRKMSLVAADILKNYIECTCVSRYDHTRNFKNLIEKLQIQNYIAKDALPLLVVCIKLSICSEQCMPVTHIDLLSLTASMKWRSTEHHCR